MAGLLLFLSLVWDAITDPLMGMAADRLRQKFSTVRVYFLLGAPLTAASFVALFHASVVWPLAAEWYVFIALIVFRTAYTIVDIPHNSMLSFLSRDSRDRTNIASLRIFFSASGKLAVTLGVASVFDRSDPDELAQGFAASSYIFAGLFLVVIGLCLAAIWNVRIYSGHADDGRIALSRLLGTLAANSQLIIVFALTAVTSLTTPVIGSTIIYYGKYGLGNEEAGATALVIMAAAQAVSLLFWSKLANRQRQKRSASRAANGLLAAAMAFGVAALDGAGTLYAVAAAAGFAIGGIFMLNWSMLPDALDHGAALSGYRYNMSIFGLYTLTNKAFIGLSQAVVGTTLAVYGYQADSVMAADAIDAIAATLLAFPLMGALACMIILAGHTQVQSHRQ